MIPGIHASNIRFTSNFNAFQIGPLRLVSPAQGHEIDQLTNFGNRRYTSVPVFRNSGTRMS